MKLTTLIELLLSVFLVRLFFMGAGVGDSFVVLGLCSILGLEKYFKTKEIADPNKDIKTRLVALEEKTSRTEAKMATLSLGGRLK